MADSAEEPAARAAVPRPEGLPDDVSGMPKEELIALLQSHASFDFLHTRKLSGAPKAVLKLASKPDWSREYVDLGKAWAELLETGAFGTAEQREADKLAHKASELRLKEAAKAEKAAADEAKRKAKEAAKAAKAARPAGGAEPELDDGVRVWCDKLPKTDGLPNCTTVKGRHILNEKRAKIVEAYKKLCEPLEGGYFNTRWNKVALDYAEDGAKSGGNLGSFPRGKMEGAWRPASRPRPPSGGALTCALVAGRFQEVAFATPVGVFTEPFKGKHGYHIFYCEERKN